MRTAKTLFLILLCLGLAAGQYLETVIPLPDSIGSVWGHYYLAWDSSGSEVYVGGTGGVVLVDAESYRRVARVLDAESIMAVCSATDLNKVYCADRVGERIWVVDCEADSVVAAVPVGLRPWRLRYSPGSQKVYCTGGEDSVALALDANTDSVIAVIQFSRYAFSMCHVPSDNELYVGSDEGVQVVDCATDSVVGEVTGAPYCMLFHYYAAANKVYAAGSDGRLCIIDCAQDSVIAVIPIDDDIAGLCSDPGRSQVYCALNGRLLFIDATADTVVYSLPLPGAVDMVFDSTRRRLYVSSASEGLVVFDVAERRIIATVKTVSDPGAVFADAQRGRVLCTDLAAGVAAVDMDSDTIVGAIPLAASSTSAVFNYLGDKLYCASAWRYVPVAVIDGARNRAVPITPLEPNPGSLSWYPKGNRLFLKLDCDTTDLVVYDCTADTVVNRIDLAPFTAHYHKACLDTFRGKLYLSGFLDNDPALGIVDCAGESLLTALGLPGELELMTLADQHAKLYCWCGIPFDYLLVVVDCDTDSITSCTQFPVPYTESAVAYSPGDAALFFAHGGTLSRLDVSSDTITADIQRPLVSWYPSVQYVPRYRKLYWYLPQWRIGRDSVLVVDPEAVSVMGGLTVGYRTTSTCLDHNGRYLFSVSEYDSCVWVIDCEVDSVVAVIDVGEWCPWAKLVLNPNDGRVYVTDCAGDIPVIKCESPGSAEEPGSSAKTCRQPTITRGVLLFGGEPASGGRQPVLLDVTGRKIMVLLPGPNDIRHLAPGVYFVRQASGVERCASSVSKVVLAR